MLDLAQTASAGATTLPDVLGRMIDVAIRHQVAAPNAARAIDDEERRLGIDDLDPESRRSMSRVISEQLLSVDHHRRWDEETLADLIAIVQTLLDRAVAAGTVPTRAHRDRICGALIGYLGV